tara:strand:+ start:341 stop:928 length:588 start_codon:yes stop_codon:yes gene_type:complete
MKYKTIYADPAWNESGGGKIKRGADRHYPLMKTKDICNLPIDKIADDNCHLYLWVTNNFLQDGLKVMDAWGFKYKTMITWTKAEKDMYDNYRLQNAGLGQYFRGLTESCLFGVKGNLPYKTKEGKRQQGCTALLAPRTKKHSQKPQEMRKMIEKVSYAPYIELFAREKTDNWDIWGNELENTVELNLRASDEITR